MDCNITKQIMMQNGEITNWNFTLKLICLTNDDMQLVLHPPDPVQVPPFVRWHVPMPCSAPGTVRVAGGRQAAEEKTGFPVGVHLKVGGELLETPGAREGVVPGGVDISHMSQQINLSVGAIGTTHTTDKAKSRSYPSRVS